MGTHNAVREKYGSIANDVAATGTAACCTPQMRCCDPISKGLYTADLSTVNVSTQKDNIASGMKGNLGDH